MWKTKKKRCINKYTISDKWAQMIANYLFNIYLKLMESNINNLKENNVKVEENYEWLKEFAELTDSASLFKLYDNFNKWIYASKDNIDLLWKAITNIKPDDLYNYVNLHKESVIKYLKLWIKFSNIFPYSKYSVNHFTEEYIDNFISKIEDEERNRMWLFFTFIWSFIGFLALVNLPNNPIYTKSIVLFVFIFICVLFVKELIFLWKNISRKKVLSNLSDFLKNEDNISEEFLKFILDYYKKFMEYDKRNKQNNLGVIKEELDFFLLDNKIFYYFKSILNLILEYKIELIISTIILILYLIYKPF